MKGIMGTTFTESVVEQAALDWLEALGYQVINGPEIAAGMILVKGLDCLVWGLGLR